VSRMLRYYSVASLLVVIAAACVMVMTFRFVAIRGIVDLAENNNLALARSAINPLRSELAEYLAAASASRREGHLVPLPASIGQAIGELLRDSRVVRVNIFGLDGVIAWSTQHDLIGTTESDGSGIAAALKGSLHSRLVYHDVFNMLDRATEDDNMVQSYVPVQSWARGPVLGILEVSTSVDALVNEAERSQVVIVFAMIVVAALLYAALLTIMRHAVRIIADQQSTIEQKNALLEQISRRNQQREELERKKFAADLHEGLAQTLSAVKLALETAREQMRAAPGTGDPLTALIPGLQTAINQARSIATEMRPSGLDQLGLIPTIQTLCEDFIDRHPGTKIVRRIDVPEAGIPAPLKLVIYRNVESALRTINEAGGAAEIRISLRTEADQLTLVVEDNSPAVTLREAAFSSGDVGSPFSDIRDRTVLSGGMMSMRRIAKGGMSLRAAWTL
jgi:signal transduction histidine kinase